MSEHPAADTKKHAGKQDQKQDKKPDKKAAKATGPIDYLDQLDIRLDGLSPKQNGAVVALLGGCTISETAGMVGVHRNTIHRWIRETPAFRKGLGGSQDELREAAVSHLHEIARKATGCIDAALDRGDARVALQLLKGIGYLGEQASSRKPYEQKQNVSSQKKNRERKANWSRRWKMPNLSRFATAGVMASSILFLLFSLLVIGMLNLAQAAGTGDASVSGSVSTSAPTGEKNNKSQTTNLNQNPKSKIKRSSDFCRNGATECATKCNIMHHRGPARRPSRWLRRAFPPGSEGVKSCSRWRKPPEMGQRIPESSRGATCKNRPLLDVAPFGARSWF